ncbi:polysaccharide biosynthesis protein [Massilia sp. Dwa41.01b]|uniref:polysaccharide biosynthesis protein n=1 Tax=unclassified Massilia TaxID=2609279 RepID=UPI0015FFF5FE|nr:MULTISPECIES: nucleoside-diphosphate sugar epimerase/dehydratase [unclassified Massilia]QNA89666.1 polysaccharide biosynthesis protein [Massilia sp. Dwa41.01b]QNB00562.1 polysaccharide biosynthesis protein [Massilia sp. Se16.2.3]
MMSKFVDRLLALPRSVKRGLALLVDVSLCVGCVWIAFGLRLEEWTFPTEPQVRVLIAAVGLSVPIYVISGMYRAIFRFSGADALMALVKASTAICLFFLLLFTFIGIPGVPRSIGLAIPLMLFVTVGASRLSVRYLLGARYVRNPGRRALPQVMIYGAGSAGRQLANSLASGQEMVVRGFIDDARNLQGGTIDGLRVHAVAGLPALVKQRGVTDLLLALPAVGRSRRAEIMRVIQDMKLPLHVRTLPGLADLAQGKVRVRDLHELDIEDLLGRDPVPPDDDLLHRNIRNKIVLVTGAGGSIGSELCRQILKLEPLTLILVELSEFALYTIHQELQAIAAGSGVRVLPMLASVRDDARMREIMRTWRPDTIYHAAAYKHVPLVEHNPAEGVRNNVLGTLVTVKAAAEYGVRDFVLISTDKAVRPTNVMGASKRLAELVLQGMALRGSATRFSMVRFGNVLGSSGSVVPLFREQIRCGGPITLTHADITRYFMTIPEAAQLVIQAGAMAEGGDVFVLDMGTPVRIIDLARRMVELSGLSLRNEDQPEGDIEIVITALRPGEKLYEELLIGDNPTGTAHPRVMRAREDAIAWDQLMTKMATLEAALAANNVAQIRLILHGLVAGYRPADEIVDWVHLEQLRQGEEADLVANS